MLDIFNDDAFSEVSLTTRVNDMPYVPGAISSSGLFREYGVTTTTIAIEKKGTTLSLIPTTPRGSPPDQVVRDKRNIRNLAIPRIAREAVVYADQVQGVRVFGSENQRETVESVLNEEFAKLTLMGDMTLENLRLGAVKGVILDADGSTLYDLFAEFGVAQEAEVDFELDVAGTNVGAKCDHVTRTIGRNLQMGTMPFGVASLCGDTFFDGLVSHATVKEAYDRWQNGQALRESYAWREFFYKGVFFRNYRGTDDGTTVAVTTTAAHFYPTGVPGLFENPFGPADTMATVNTIGLPRYAFQDPSKRTLRSTSVEFQSNPLPFCTKPKVLMKAKHS